MTIYHRLMRPILFRLNAEVAHQVGVEACRWAGFVPLLRTMTRSCFDYRAPELETVVAGLQFSNPLGLAAGWDKSGRAMTMLDSLGFGFVEIGSVSAFPSGGNPRPRLFRLPKDRALIVNYGLPNDGAETVARRLTHQQRNNPLGVNIVKTNFGPHAPACSTDDILDDYFQSVRLLQGHVDYLTLNLSCPNATGGKDFFALPGNICQLLEKLKELHIACPVFLKVAPNPQPTAIEQLIDETVPFEFVRGFIFNLPAGKPSSWLLKTPLAELETMPGAVAGKPVQGLINQCISELFCRMPQKRFAIIGSGGIFTAADAYEKIRLGASLVQIYTALIYEGPSVIAKINHGLQQLLRRDGFRHISQAVGTAHLLKGCLGDRPLSQ